MVSVMVMKKVNQPMTNSCQRFI